MTTDVHQIATNLAEFYDFGGRIVIDVGGGGGQLIDYANGARKVIAVDHDPTALARLAARVRERGLDESFILLNSPFLEVGTAGDVVVLEFCLHMMADPERAVAHARRLAPDVVVIGHAPASPWSWCAAEDEGVEAAWNAVAAVGVRRQRDFMASQRFADYAELEAKLAGCAAESLARIQGRRGQVDIMIPMPYRVALCA
jgi:SAM-dependent methyltransferase